MIIGLGIDIVEISRIKKWMATSGLIERYFHPAEIIEAKSRGSSAVQALAARFAAKEAFGKALGTGLRQIELRDIQLFSQANGKPEIILHGKARIRFKEFGGKALFVSLTHEKNNAVAVVVIEGG